MRVGIIGGGRAAWAFGETWRRAGWPIVGVALRAGSSSQVPALLDAPRRSVDELARDAELLFLAVTDAALPAVHAALPASAPPTFHASGGIESFPGGFSLHPLCALPASGEPVDLRGVLLVFEGVHLDIAKAIADAAGARLCVIGRERKALYHAAAVFGSNYVALMSDIAEQLMSRAGVPCTPEDIRRLALSALDNWSTHRDERRFTGPAARRDANTLQLHHDALTNDPALSALYEQLAARVQSILAAAK